MQKGLGKGLGALFEDLKVDDIHEKAKVDKKITSKKEISKKNNNDMEENNNIVELKITQVEPNSEQPRKRFETKKIDELAESIKAHGVIQPIIVKKNKYGYVIIAGERRWRAAKVAGLNKIPAIIREYDDKKVQEVALIENIQRENLNSIEQAKAFKEIIDSYNMTQEGLAKTIGKSRTAIANILRLLSLSPSIQDMVIKGDLSEAQARYLLAIKDEDVREELAKKVVEHGITVKQLESIVYNKEGKKKESNSKVINNKKLVIFEKIEEELNKYFMTKVGIKQQDDKKGKIVIEYYSDDDLNRILEQLGIKM